MRRSVSLLGLIVVLTVTAGFVVSAQMRTGNIPPGVSPAKWIPLTETSGIVLKEPLLDRQKILNHGTLMVKVQDGWREVYLDNAPHDFMPVKP
jgi:hypothetical protein